HEQHGTQDLPPVGERVADEARQLAHTAPSRPQCLTDGGIGMRCKGLFYCAAAESPSSRFRLSLTPLLRHIPMHNLPPVSGFAQALAYFLGNHHRTVLAAGAAKTDGEIALAFVDVVGQQVDQ